MGRNNLTDISSMCGLAESSPLLLKKTKFLGVVKAFSIWQSKWPEFVRTQMHAVYMDNLNLHLVLIKAHCRFKPYELCATY